MHFGLVCFDYFKVTHAHAKNSTQGDTHAHGQNVFGGGVMGDIAVGDVVTLCGLLNEENVYNGMQGQVVKRDLGLEAPHIAKGDEGSPISERVDHSPPNGENVYNGMQGRVVRRDMGLEALHIAKGYEASPSSERVDDSTQFVHAVCSSR